MLPSDFSSEKLARQRFLKREVDMRKSLHEAKLKISNREPFWTIEVQFSKEDEIDVRDEPGSGSVSHWFRKIITAGNFNVTAGSQRRLFIEVRAKSGKEAIKIINTFLTQAEKVAGGAR